MIKISNKLYIKFINNIECEFIFENIIFDYCLISAIKNNDDRWTYICNKLYQSEIKLIKKYINNLVFG